MANLNEGESLKQEEGGGWLLTDGAGYIWSRKATEFSHLCPPVPTMDHGKIETTARLPSGLKFFGNMRGLKGLVIKFVGRREGDIGIVVAEPSKAEHVLGFKAKHDSTRVVALIQ